MQKPIVSIIIPIYNVRKYIERCILSVINQTYKEIELIIINDGTKDDSIILATGLLEEYRYPYKLVDQNNSGVSVARNVGIRQSSGDYIFVMDSDDIIHPKAIEILCDICSTNNVDCVFSNYQIIDQNKDLQSINGREKIYIRTSKDACKKFFTRQEKYIAPALMIRRSVLVEKELYYDERCRFAEDDLFVWNVLAVTTKIAYYSGMLYGYVFHENSTMTSSSYDKYVSSYLACCELRKRVIDNSPNTSGMSDKFVARHMLGVIHAAAKVLDYEEFMKLIDSTSFRKESCKILLSKDLRITAILIQLFLSSRQFHKFCRKF